MRSQCIQCMEREGDPRNGGYCTVCAPPLRALDAIRRRHSIRIRVYKAGRAA